MATASFAAILQNDGTIMIPQEVIEKLGLRPGDTVQVRVESANDGNAAEEPDQDLREV